MKNVKKIICILLAAALIAPVSSTNLYQDSMVVTAADEEWKPLKLWYDKPAEQLASNEADQWENYGLPIGNGQIGGVMFGDAASEHIQFNEDTLWSGGPSASRPNYKGGNIMDRAGYVKQAQDYLAAGNTSAATSICNTYLIGESDGYGAYQTFGDFYLDFALPGSSVTNYSRELDIRNAAAGVSFTNAGVNFKREYFVSYPDDVMVMGILADQAGKVSFTLRYRDPGGRTGVTTTANAADGTLRIAGTVTDNQMEYEALFKVVKSGGTFSTSGTDKLVVTGADSVYIVMNCATNYVNDYPTYRREVDLAAEVAECVDKAASKPYETLLADHTADYKELFDRVGFDLGGTAPALTTDQLLSGYKGGSLSDSDKKYLEELYFQYGRYLLIASSRGDSLPANLQGIWNRVNNPPWGSDYHININLQMNYWPAYVTNIAETALPMVEYMDSLREPGRVTAEAYHGIESTPENPEQGFVAHTQNTPFGWTCPGWSFSWGWSTSAVAWMMQNVYDYYEFTQDKEYLEETIWPMLRETALFWDQVLVYDQASGRWVSSPTYSPEHGPYTIGNTFEQTLVYELINMFKDAMSELGSNSVEDIALLDSLTEKQSKMKPLTIGSWGQIWEWWDEDSYASYPGESQHRHLSHLLGLYPGRIITSDTPGYMEAAKASLNHRGDAATGWSMGHKLNLWARTGDGDHAYVLYGNLLKNGTLPNLWDTHTPFQIDGNFGGTSGVAEMVLQSHAGFIDLLPAIPQAWKSGSVSGLKARGDYTVGMEWSDNALETAVVTAGNDGACTIKNDRFYNSTSLVVTDGNGNPVDFDIDNGKVTFNAKAAETYTVMVQETETSVESVRLLNGALAVTLKDAGADVTAEDFSIMARFEGEAAEDLETYGFIYDQAKKTAYFAFAPVSADTRKMFYAGVRYVEGVPYKWSDGLMLSPTGGNELVDDRDPRVTYTGAWSTYDNSENYNGTEMYTNETGAYCEFDFYGTGIIYWGMKQSNQGAVDIYLDGEKVADNLSIHNSSTMKKVNLYEKRDLPPGDHTIKVVALSSGTVKASLDAFQYFNDVPYLSDIAVNNGEVSVKFAQLNGAAVSAEELQLFVSVSNGEPVPVRITGFDFDAGTGVATLTFEPYGNQVLQVGVSYHDLTPVYTVSLEGAIIHEVAVTYEAGEGGGIDGKTNQTVALGGNTEPVTAVPKPGYTFVRWDDGETKETRNETNVQTDMTFKAEFKKADVIKTYTVTLDPDGGAVSKKTIEVNAGSAIGALPNPTRTGYTFKGWYTSKTGGVKITDTTKVTASMTVHARWEKASPPIGTTFKSKNLKYKVVKKAGAKASGSVQATGSASKNLRKISIPNTVRYKTFTYKVVSIKGNAFKKNKKVTSVTVGNNVKTIGNNAFSGCSKLKDVKIGTGVTKIGKKVFYNDKRLRTIKILSKKLTSVGRNTFKNIHKNAVIKVPPAKLNAYKDILKGKGQKNTVVIK